MRIFDRAHAKPKDLLEALRAGDALDKSFLAGLQGVHLMTTLPCFTGLVGSSEENSLIHSTHPD